MTLPDCMMPDGAEPCKGYQELLAEVERLQEVIKANNYAQDITLREAGAKITEAAALLDALAGRIENWPPGASRYQFEPTAADCRAMAEKLRGEGFGPFDVNPGGQYQP